MLQQTFDLAVPADRLDELKAAVLTTVATRWRSFKCRLNAIYILQMMMINIPEPPWVAFPEVTMESWDRFVENVKSPEFQVYQIIISIHIT